MRQSKQSYLLVFLLSWIPGSALMIFLLLRFGKNWGGVSHALFPAAMISGALIGMVLFVVWSFRFVFGARSALAAEATKILDQRYLSAFRPEDELRLSAPRQFVGGVVRYTGTLAGLPVLFDFFTGTMQQPRFEGDLGLAQPTLEISLATFRLKLQGDEAMSQLLFSKASAAAGLAGIKLRLAGSELLNDGSFVLAAAKGGERIPPERFRAFLTGLAAAARS